LRLEISGNSATQTSGWTHDHYVTGVLLFCPDGTICISFYNVPGSVHDSHVAEFGKIYEKLMTVFDKCNSRCTADSAFAAGRFPFLIK
jgi:hypothetical protein